MLKIKDLSVLEEYGFEKKTNEWFVEYYRFPKEYCGSWLTIYPITKIINIELDYDITDVADICLDKIYELIQAGLVEKVSNE